jgi:hypothetical protein
LADDTWHHYVYQGDSTSVRLYIDGLFVGSDGTTPTTTYNGDFELGGTSQFNEDITGLLSEVSVWDQALSLKDLNLLRAFGSGNEFLYNTQQIEQLMAIDSVGESIVIDGTTWTFRDNLTIGGPELNNITQNSGAYFFGLTLGTGNGTALSSNATAIITPEPSTAFLAVIGMVVLSVRRRTYKYE